MKLHVLLHIYIEVALEFVGLKSVQMRLSASPILNSKNKISDDTFIRRKWEQGFTYLNIPSISSI